MEWNADLRHTDQISVKHVPKLPMSTKLRAGCLVANAPFQTLSKQPTVCVKHFAVWPLSVKQGPTRWASRSLTLFHFLTAWLDRLPSILRFTDLTSSSVSPETPKNTSYAHIKLVFPGLLSLWWEIHPSSSQSSLLTQQRPACDRN